MVPESSFGLVNRAKAGDASALDRLILRYLPRLRRWTRRRLPSWARDLAETEDIVQETIFSAVRNLPTFEMREVRSLRSYMKRALTNRVRDEVKRVVRQPRHQAITDASPSRSPSPIDHAIAREDLLRCRAALARLRPADRRVILARLSGAHSHSALARHADRPTSDAARMALSRALARLAAEMDRLDS